jgi:hypothetical protein
MKMNVDKDMVHTLLVQVIEGGGHSGFLMEDYTVSRLS